MKRIPNEECASICGLFCGACPSFPEQRHGCLSDYVREGCRECKNGFRDCAKEHNGTRCHDCSKFPCSRLESFSKGPIIDGVNNHENVIPDLHHMKAVGTANWIKEKLTKHTCQKCGELITWYEMGKHICKK